MNLSISGSPTPCGMGGGMRGSETSASWGSAVEHAGQANTNARSDQGRVQDWHTFDTRSLGNAGGDTEIDRDEVARPAEATSPGQASISSPSGLDGCDVQGPNCRLEVLGRFLTFPSTKPGAAAMCVRALSRLGAAGQDGRSVAALLGVTENRLGNTDGAVVVLSDQPGVGVEKFPVMGKSADSAAVEQDLAPLELRHCDQAAARSRRAASSSDPSKPSATNCSCNSRYPSWMRSSDARSSGSIDPFGEAPLLEAMSSSLGMPPLVAPASAPNKSLIGASLDSPEKESLLMNPQMGCSGMSKDWLHPFSRNTPFEYLRISSTQDYSSSFSGESSHNDPPMRYTYRMRGMMGVSGSADRPRGACNQSFFFTSGATSKRSGPRQADLKTITGVARALLTQREC
jgi:hypothetical protein